MPKKLEEDYFLEFAISSFCQAKCPSCNRTNPETLEQQSWLTPEHFNIDTFKKMMSPDYWRSRKITKIKFCGENGDPMMHPKIQEFIDDEVNQTITIFEEEYPDLSNEFIRIQTEMYAMFAAKHMDYGLNNISLGGDIVNNSDDKKFSLTGLAIRLTDKISRLKNLLVNGRSFVEGEGMEDTFIDIANYGIIGLLVGRDKWKK